jgi:hypothetical protein
VAATMDKTKRMRQRAMGRFYALCRRLFSAVDLKTSGNEPPWAVHCPLHAAGEQQECC